MFKVLQRMALPEVCPVCLVDLRQENADVCAACGRLLQTLPGPRCSGCGGSIDGILERCHECLVAESRPWQHAVTAFRFGGLVRELIHRFKYQGHTYLAPLLASRMVASWQRHGRGSPDIVVPVPLHWMRQVRRQYNQSELLAAHIGHTLGLPVRLVIRRYRRTHQQAMLDFSTRQANMKHVFAVKARQNLSGLHVLLVDDVLTTGATLTAATEVLLNSRAATVSIITAARG